MVTYKLVNKPNSNEFIGVIRSDGWYIPPVDDNTDYQQYLKWVEAGNQPEPADE
jgi:hypothetical protein